MDFVTCLRHQLQSNANLENASKMQAYMKTQQPFLGVAAPVRKTLFSQTRKHYRIDTQQEYEDIVQSLWRGSGTVLPYREEQYLALEVAERYKKFRVPESMPLYVSLLSTAENWDTVDWIGINLIGQLIKEHPEFECQLRAWREHDNIWFRRTSLIAHIKHKVDTNTALMAETILLLCHEKAFFIRKAIGWVLREYSKADPQWVSDFVTKHDTKLSGLSKREALKAINKNKEK